MPYRNRSKSVLSKYFKRRTTFFKGVRRTGRRARSNRIFRRFIRRRAIRPELKWASNSINATVGNQAGATNVNSYSFALTPQAIGQGTGIGDRIGNELNFIKVDIRTTYVDDSTLTDGNRPAHHSYLVRQVIWSPRVDIDLALAYMNDINSYSNIDFNNATILSDTTFTMSPRIEGVAGVVVGQATNPSLKLVTRKVKFPRKVKFSNNTLTTVDEEKYTLYMTIVCDTVAQAGVHHYTEAKTWYFDS